MKTVNRGERPRINGTVIYHPDDVKGNEHKVFKYSFSPVTENSDSVMLQPILAAGETQDTVDNPDLIIPMALYSRLKRQSRGY